MRTYTRRARRTLAASVATGLIAAASIGSALAQTDEAGLYGTWYSVERPGGVRLTETAVIQFNGNQEWPNDAQSCVDDFAHEVSTVDGQSLYVELSQNPVYDNDDVPIAAGLEGRFPEGPLPLLYSRCHGAAEIGGAVYYALVAPDRLLAVAFGDGIYGIENYQHEPPLVPPQSLDQATREAIQRALLARGYYDDEIDGLFGPGTRAAIGDYQESLGDEPTGILDRHQLDLLLGG